MWLGNINSGGPMAGMEQLKERGESIAAD